MRISATVIAGLLISCSNLPASAQSGKIFPVQRVSASGPTRIYSWFNCNTARLPIIQTKVDAGSVQMRSGVQRRCGYERHPVAEYWYVPPAGFKGQTNVWFFPTGGSPIQKRLRVE
jgi:hypothetical protein